MSQGNTGSEADFLNGITGPQGPQGSAGSDGANGQDGQDGLSAYEVWLAQGNTGTEADFLTGITGPQGPQGPQGDPGSLPTGTNNGDILYWDGSDWVLLDAGQTGETLNMCYGVPTWGPCPAQVQTSPISNITGFDAESGGEVINDGGNPITNRGICWGILPNPDLNNNFTSNGTGLGVFTSSMTNLSPTTTYYVRAYATNLAGTVYGNEIEFTSGADVPTVVTDSIYAIHYDSCIVDAEVSDNGGASITERGICYSTTPNPTVADNQISNGAGLGSYSTSLTGLSGSTTYYVRAYAVNSSGVSYGNEISFNTISAPSGLSCNSCGPAGGQSLSSPQMSGGIIYGSVGQVISMTAYKCGTSQYLSCGNSGFTNPPEATVLSYTCIQGTGSDISQSITFDTPGIYSVTGRAGSSVSQKICTVSIVISP